MINEHNNSKQKQTLSPNNTQIPPTWSYRKGSHLDTIPQTKTNLRPVAGMQSHNITHANIQPKSSSPPPRPPIHKGWDEVGGPGAMINTGKTYKGRVNIETPNPQHTLQNIVRATVSPGSGQLPGWSTAPLSSRWMYLDHHF